MVRSTNGPPLAQTTLSLTALMPLSGQLIPLVCSVH
jgi:hypothetical protein